MRLGHYIECNSSVFLCVVNFMGRRINVVRLQRKIKNKLSVVPFEPGCYLMKDRNDQVIYVGKAKRLRNRLRSYFTGAHDAKTTRLVGEIEILNL